MGYRLLLKVVVGMVFGFVVKEDDLKGFSGFDVFLKWKYFVSV